MLRASNQPSKPFGDVSSVETPPELAGLPVLSEEWQAIVNFGPNVLVEGPEPSTERVIRAVTATRQSAACEWNSSEPHEESGAMLIVRGVDRLSEDDHRRLLGYLNAGEAKSRARQVITTSTRSVYALVESGTFDSSLYYRLNTIRLELGES